MRRISQIPGCKNFRKRLPALRAISRLSYSRK
nr:GCC1 protein [Homo sapiens]